MRDSYDRIASEYAAHLFDELSHKPFDRERLDEFVPGSRNAGIRFVGGDNKSPPLDDESLAGIVAFYSIVNFHQSELNGV